MVHKRALVWFRNDLRIHDNLALLDAYKYASEIVPVYIFDDRYFKAKTPHGFPKMGKYRTKFIIESIVSLQNSFRGSGTEIIVKCGITEEIIQELATKYNTDKVFCNRERTPIEVEIQDNVEKNLWQIGQELIYSRGKMLYYTSDLPFPISHTPDTFKSFKKEVEKFIPVRKPLHITLEKKTSFSLNMENTRIPSMSDFGYEDFINDAGGFTWIGGEEQALKQVDEYIWESEKIKEYIKYKQSIYGEVSSRLSPYLSVGCLSPKYLYWELRRYEDKKGSNDSVQMILNELMWRDYFRLIAKKYGQKIFSGDGICEEEGEKQFMDDNEQFIKWTQGKTDVDLINAIMIDLNHTGWLPYPARNIAAHYLVDVLKISWLKGAEFFESLLIDFDPASNYGNWCYVAGLGNDTRDHRYTNIYNLIEKYEKEQQYIDYWLSK